MAKRWLLPTGIFVMGLGFFFWSQTSDYWKAIRQIGGVLRLVHKEYVDEAAVTYGELAESAIRGVVSSLDPYSQYMNSEQYARFHSGTEQRYVGIGVEIQNFGDWVTVVDVFPGGSAESAGVRSGDIIAAIEGESMREAGLAEVSRKLLGAPGDRVEVEFWRGPAMEPLALALRRKEVAVSTVRDVRLSENGIGSFRLTGFGERTENEFLAAEQRLWEDGLQGLIIDLRNNPGGLLRTAKALAGYYLKENSVVVSLEGRDIADFQQFRAGGELSGRLYPIALLINEGSASGSEIFAGALQDYGRARIFGTTSHGKGSVQSVYRFRDGGGMRQTTALYRLPSGRSIHEVGVDPDVVVETPAGDRLRSILQERHQSAFDAASFESTFGFAPDVADPAFDAAQSWMEEQVSLTFH